MTPDKWAEIVRIARTVLSMRVEDTWQHEAVIQNNSVTRNRGTIRAALDAAYEAGYRAGAQARKKP